MVSGAVCSDMAELTFTLKPSRSLMTPDTADRITTCVMLYRRGFMVRPYSLKGLSSS